MGVRVGVGGGGGGGWLLSVDERCEGCLRVNEGFFSVFQGPHFIEEHHNVLLTYFSAFQLFVTYCC